MEKEDYKLYCPKCGSCNWQIFREVMGNETVCGSCLYYLKDYEYNRQKEKLEEY